MASHVKIVQSNYKGVSDLETFMDWIMLPSVVLPYDNWLCLQVPGSLLKNINTLMLVNTIQIQYSISYNKCKDSKYVSPE